jgi:hypothetical protein
VNAPTDRDQALERVLRQSLKTFRGSATASCLDAETLAVWAEGGLSGNELEAAQSHVADCARCQASLAALLQTSSIQTVTSSTRSEKAPWRLFAWIVPLTAAAAIAIWVAVPRGPASQSQVAEVQSQPAQLKAPETPAPAAGLQSPSPSEKKEEQPVAAKGDQPVRDQAQASALSKDTDRRELDSLKQSQSADAAGARADKSRAAAEPAAPAAAPVAAAPPRAAEETRQAFQETSANIAVQKAAPARTPGSAAAVQWRISGITLQRSSDAGSTWNVVDTGMDARVTALSSPSPAVCWVVGRGGFVLRTQDGQNFSRVAFPEMTDLSAVQATNAQSATVTSRDGRRFTTTDGGATWQVVR